MSSVLVLRVIRRQNAVSLHGALSRGITTANHGEPIKLNAPGPNRESHLSRPAARRLCWASPGRCSDDSDTWRYGESDGGTLVSKLAIYRKRAEAKVSGHECSRRIPVVFRWVGS